MEKRDPLNKSFKNTRRHRRFVVETLDIRIRAKAVSERAAPEDYRAKKLNLGGVLMESDHVHELTSRLQIELTLPDNVRISLTGRVTSCIPVDATRYDVGIEFISMTEQDRTKLKKFIQWLYLKDAGFAE